MRFAAMLKDSPNAARSMQRFDIRKSFRGAVQEMELSIFRVWQECLTTIHRHAGVRDGWNPHYADRGLLKSREMQARDSARKGVGVRGLSAQAGVGLRGMREGNACGI